MDLYGGASSGWIYMEERAQDEFIWWGVHRMNLCEEACIGSIYMAGMFICMGAYFTGQKQMVGLRLIYKAQFLAVMNPLQLNLSVRPSVITVSPAEHLLRNS